MQPDISKINEAADLGNGRNLSTKQYGACVLFRASFLVQKPDGRPGRLELSFGDKQSK